MRIHRLSILLFAALALGACDGQNEGPASQDLGAFKAAPAPMMAVESSDAVMERRQASPQNGGNAVESPNAMIAYRYSTGVSLPADAVEPTMKRHMQSCLDAGPKLCQVLNASSQNQTEDYSTAQLSLRAAPGWLDEFRNGLQDSLADADGKVINSSVSAEDLTRRIFDADARLTAQTALRDRLLTLLETRDAKLQELLSVERELARVQAEIESATALLKTLRQRVSMSVMDLRYETRARAVSTSAVSPVTDALRNFIGTLSRGLASVIGFIAIALPWLLFVILPGAALFRWLLRRRRKTT
jgi:hypothetical protein